ncbi:MAG: polyphenol oxidase family protein [Holosporales bacterium]|nr:polyphenol oxidase family protein [Holosporales bacterium]
MNKINIEYAKNLSKIQFVKHGFFGRSGGVGKPPHDTLNASLRVNDDTGAVLENRTRIAATFGLPLEKMLIPHQIHSNVAVVIDRLPCDAGPIIPEKTDKQQGHDKFECDAFITNVHGLLIGVTTADCVPILACDVKKGYIAAIHAGWRGALVGIVEKTFEKLTSLGCTDIICAIGPCIHQESFLVGEEIIGKVPNEYIANCKFDLPGYVSDKLLSCGAKDVSKINIDTFQNEEYFSYRRQSGARHGYGAQFSGIMVNGEWT